MELHRHTVRIRSVDVSDAAFYIALANHPSVSEKVNHPQPYTQADFDAMLERARTTNSFAWVIMADTHACGVVTLAQLKHPHQYQGGYWMQPEFTGRGIATAAWNIAVKYVQETCGALRVQALVEPENHASIRVLEKAGFVHEGLLCKYYPSRYRGLLDVHMYACVFSS